LHGGEIETSSRDNETVIPRGKALASRLSNGRRVGRPWLR
jgi:hypothetical protein